MATTYKLPKQISTTKRASLRVAVLAFIVLLAAGPGRAQMRPMGMPLTTTLVISRPGPEQLFGDKQLITLGLNDTELKFLLNDAYVDDVSGRVRWPDIWQQVRIYRPNIVLKGQNAYTLSKLKPGDVVTVKGMYAPLDRTFEVMFVQPGKGAFEPKREY